MSGKLSTPASRRELLAWVWFCSPRAVRTSAIIGARTDEGGFDSLDRDANYRLIIAQRSSQLAYRAEDLPPDSRALSIAFIEQLLASLYCYRVSLGALALCWLAGAKD
jgi:hypothetical protein